MKQSITTITLLAMLGLGPSVFAQDKTLYKCPTLNSDTMYPLTKEVLVDNNGKINRKGPWKLEFTGTTKPEKGALVRVPKSVRWAYFYGFGNRKAGLGPTCETTTYGFIAADGARYRIKASINPNIIRACEKSGKFEWKCIPE